MEKRDDKPKCPYCDSQLALYAQTGQISDTPQKVQNIETPKYRLELVSLYCTNAECTGASMTGHNTGYDIKISHI